MTSNTGLVLEFVAAWSRRDITEIMSYISPDCVYHNIPFEPATGRSAIKSILAPLVARSQEIEWQVLQIGTSPIGAVLTERLDRFRINGKWVEIRVMGTFELAENRIVAWRDYFDAAQFHAQLAD